jgi:hypothetical protein
MQITKRRLKEIIKEEMEHLAETGDINAITESEKMAFQIILEKLSPAQLKEMGLSRIQEDQKAQKKEVQRLKSSIKDLGDKIKKAETNKEYDKAAKLKSQQETAERDLQRVEENPTQRS